MLGGTGTVFQPSTQKPEKMQYNNRMKLVTMSTANHSKMRIEFQIHIENHIQIKEFHH